MVSKDKIKKIVKKLKKKKVPKKKKTGLKQKQRQKQSVIQNVKVSAPQQSSRAIGFPTQIIQQPSSDTEFLRSVIQQQNQNNLTRDYQAKNPQQVSRLGDQVGLRTQEAFPQPPPPGIEATIPEAQATAQTQAETPKKPRTNWKDMSDAELAQRAIKGSVLERKTARRVLRERERMAAQNQPEIRARNPRPNQVTQPYDELSDYYNV